TPLRSSVVFSSSISTAAATATVTRLPSCSSATIRSSNGAGESTLAVHARRNVPDEPSIDRLRPNRTPASKKSKSTEARNGKYERPATFKKPLEPEIFQHRFIYAFTRALARFDGTINYVLWDFQIASPGMTLSKPAHSTVTSANEAQLHRKPAPPSLEERTAAAIAKLVKLGYVSQARQVLEMSNQLQTRFSPESLATIARAIANGLSSFQPPTPTNPSSSSSSQQPPPYPTLETIEQSSKWLLWELRPQLCDAAKRRKRDALYQSQLTCAIEEFMWCSVTLRDWTGVLETFDGTAMNVNAKRIGGLPSVKMCQLAMQALFARHYYDAPGKGKDKATTEKDEEKCRRGVSKGKAKKEGYAWTIPADHTVLFRKIARMIEVMRKSGVDPLYPEVHAILLRELGRLVSSGKTLMSVKLVEDWLVFYEAAMAVRVPPAPTSTSTPSEPSSSSSPSPQSQPPTAIILAAAEAILHILEEAKNQLGFRWTKAAQVSVALQKREYLETTLKAAFDEVVGYLEVPSSPPLREAIDQHAKTQSVIIRRYLLQDDIRAAWGVWTRLVKDVEEAVRFKEGSRSRGKRNGDNLHRLRTTIPPTTSLRLDSAYSRILHTARRLGDLEFISTTALPLSSRILVGRNPDGFADIWRKTLETMLRRSPTEEERLRLLSALKTLDKVLEERVATSATQPRGGQEPCDVIRGIFTGALVDAVRVWWSASDVTSTSTKEIGEMFEKFGIVLKVPLKKRRLSSPGWSDV
ncbi:hypothetical protein FRC01_008763, partial [Tulasnella sp. 417]